jgi:hypothetical protein
MDYIRANFFGNIFVKTPTTLSQNLSRIILLKFGTIRQGFLKILTRKALLINFN